MSLTMRKRDKKWETQDTLNLENWISGERHIDECLEFMKGHIEVYFEVASEYDYDGDRAIATLSGWRDSTPKEISDKQATELESAQKSLEWEEAQIAKLRKARPELFK